LTFLALLALPLRADLRTDLDAFARKAMADIGTAPGITVVVVKDDKVVYRGDFGLRDVEAKLPVTPDTRFYIASSTKAFTAMAAAILAEEGKLNLDAPISDAWPEVKFTAPLDAKRFSLRDFLAMRSGLDNGTLNFRSVAGNIADEQELLRILGTYSREQPRVFRYSNMSYIVAAHVMEKAAGKSWRDLVAEKILIPLGMTSTSTTLPPPDVPAAQFYRSTAANVFVPSTRDKTNDTMGPAGGMLTTSTDIAKWLIALINERGLPKRAIRMVQSAQTTNKARFRYIDRFAWGLGQDLGDYESDLIIHRFGGFGGAYSHVSFMPEHRIGVAVFSNGGGAVPDAIAAYAYDHLLGKKNLDAKWSAEIARVATAANQARAERRAAEARMTAHHDNAHPLAQYAGTYHYDRLGDIELTVSGDHLDAQLGLLRAPMFPAGNDDFLVDWQDEGEPEPVKFTFDENGRAQRLDWGGRVFDRVP